MSGWRECGCRWLTNHTTVLVMHHADADADCPRRCRTPQDGLPRQDGVVSIISYACSSECMEKDKDDACHRSASDGRGQSFHKGKLKLGLDFIFLL